MTTEHAVLDLWTTHSPKSLYDQNPIAWDKMATEGGESIAEMAKFFFDQRSMNDALGYTDAVKNWLSGRSGASSSSIRRAYRWLKERENVSSTKNGAAAADVEPDPVEAPSAPKHGAMLFVACPPGSEAKVLRVLSFLGCEVTEC